MRTYPGDVATAAAQPVDGAGAEPPRRTVE
jgi:hypothetical protein